MRRWCGVPAVVMLVWALGNQALGGDPVFPQGSARRSMGNLRRISPEQESPPAAAPARDSRARTRDRWHERFYHGHGRFYRDRCPHDYRWGGYWYGGPGPCPPYWWDPYCVPPVYIPAEELYGPLAVRRFMGWEAWSAPRPKVNVIVAEGKQDEPADGEEAEGPDLRGTNARALSLAWKFIGYGDAHFSNQEYSDAYLRYRKAARAAPQLADGYFRQGYALAAMGRYDLAARAMKRGLGLAPDWPRSDFHNDQLYGENQLAERAHADAMAQAAEQQPHDADLLFLLGVYLHFDGKPDRAGTFFRRALQLAGEDSAHLRAFLEP